jgi:lipopolysaccharide export system protein LptA
VSCCIDPHHPDRTRERHRKIRWLGGAGACALFALLAPLTPASSAAGEMTAGDLPCNEPPMCYRASHLDAERNRVVLYDFDIVDMTRGISHIKADRAEGDGLDFANSRWVLTGHVQLFIPEGQMSADKATVLFASQRIQSMTAEGAPAEFEHPLENGQKAHGHAQAIDYDVARNEVQLHGDAWLSDGCNEITSEHISYDLVSQRVRADSAPGDNARVHGTIGASNSTKCAASTGSRP